MTNTISNKEQFEILLGGLVIPAWNELIGFVESNYDFEPVWNNGGKYGIWEVKYRRSGKTLCALYIKDGCFTVLVVLGKAEREKFESLKEEFNPKIYEIYVNTRQYHDGKWLWINVSDMSLVEDIKKLIVIKKKPTKKGFV
ncbi:MAG: hypothetical protein APF77_06705 [Clostridia bacterium BRH_c25]|nr:MAG: hypothetical protein APF77_06705 [Clostridia bacterium BRH_c25]